MLIRSLRLQERWRERWGGEPGPIGLGAWRRLVLDEIIVHREGIERIPLGLENWGLGGHFQRRRHRSRSGLRNLRPAKLARLPASVPFPTNF